MLIIPGFKMKCAKFFGRFVSDKKLMAITYRIQKKKVKQNPKNTRNSIFFVELKQIIEYNNKAK